jgi:hypothetical protein
LEMMMDTKIYEIILLKLFISVTIRY